MFLFILLTFLSLLLSYFIYKQYKFKIKLFIKHYFIKTDSSVNIIDFQDSKYEYFADDDIITSFDQFKCKVENYINNVAYTKLDIYISDYPILKYKAEHQKNKHFNYHQLISFINTLTSTYYPILYQIPNKLNVYIDQPYIVNKDLKHNYFDYKIFKNMINFYPEKSLNDFMNYIYIDTNDFNDFKNTFMQIIKQESSLVDYRSRVLIFKNLNNDFDITLKQLVYCLLEKNNNVKKESFNSQVLSNIQFFKTIISTCRSLIIFLDYQDSLIYCSKPFKVHNECKPINKITTKSLFSDFANNDFKNIVINNYQQNKDKKKFYALLIVIKLMNRLNTDEFISYLEEIILKYVSSSDTKEYYTTKIENYIYTIYVTICNNDLINLQNYLKIVVPRFEITATLNNVKCLDEYDLRNSDVKYVIKILSLLQYAKEPKYYSVILDDYSKTTEKMKVSHGNLIKEDIDYESFMTLKKLVFNCYINGINIKIANNVSNNFFKIYFTNKQYLKLNELDHNIFPINHDNIYEDLNIYKNMNTLIEFVNLKKDINYKSLFDEVIIPLYKQISDMKNYFPEVKKLKYVEFNIRNPLNITIESITAYPNLVNNTILFDLTGKFSVALKFLYSIIVDSSKLSNDIERCKVLFYDIGIEMNVVNFNIN